MTTALWQWAKTRGYAHNLDRLADKLGYGSTRYVEQLLRGWTPLTDAFKWRFMRAFPEDGQQIFLSIASDETDIISGNGDTNA